jgi:hypothetical protein
VGGREFVRESRFEVVSEEKPPCPTPTVTLSASSGAVTTVQGEGWLPGGTVAFTLIGPTQFYINSAPVPDSGKLDFNISMPSVLPGDYDLVFSQDHDGCKLRVRKPFTIVASSKSDTQYPTVSWVKPVGNDGVYEASSGTVELEVSATYNADIGLAGVNFERWDDVNQRMIVISSDSSPPYQASVEVNTLNIGWNQIRAVAVDTAYNRGVALIGIYRQRGEGPSCPTPTVKLSTSSVKIGDTIMVEGKDWLPGGKVALIISPDPADNPGATQINMGSVPVSESGEWQSSFAVPERPPGGYDLIFSEVHNGCLLHVTKRFTSDSMCGQGQFATEFTPGGNTIFLPALVPFTDS